jgi:alkylation response protein AidB-like acyl-CoA dehydrogenase
MDFELSEEQRMLRESLSRLLADRYDFAQRNRYRRSEAGYDPTIWQAYADMGLLALNVPQVHGGLEAGAGETFIVMSEMGKALTVEPFLPTCVLAPELLKAAGEEQAGPVLERIAQGKTVVAYARHEPAHWAGKADDLSVTAMETGSGWRLNGVKSPVRHGAQADMLIVSAQSGGETELFIVQGDASACGATLKPRTACVRQRSCSRTPRRTGCVVAWPRLRRWHEPRRRGWLRFAPRPLARWTRRSN